MSYGEAHKMVRHVLAADYGVEGDNSTNAAPAIQAAIDACVAAGGGTVSVPKGIYRLGRVLKMHRNVRLSGDD